MEQLEKRIISQFPCSLIVKEDVGDLIHSIVDLLENRIHSHLATFFTKPLGLATGRTMEPIYELLVERFKAWPKLDFEKLRNNWLSFNLDEYVGLNHDDPNSFTFYMNRSIGELLELSPMQLRIPNGQCLDPVGEANFYLQELKSFGGLGLQLLGLGSNGHLGFNEPPCSPNSSCRVVDLTMSTRQQNAFAFNNEPKEVPPRAITLGIQEILKADEIHLIVTGSAKASILNSLFFTSCSEELPASWLRFHRNVFLWTDYAALGELM